MSMFCKYCGQEIADDSVFCSKCGKSLKETTETVALDTAVPEKPAVDPNTWYYLDGTELGGPMSADLLKKKLLNGDVDYECKVRNSPSDPWAELIDSPFADIALKLRPKPVIVSDKWLWCLGILPLAITILISYFGVFPSGSAAYWIVPAALNTLFFFLDLNELDKKQIYSGGWGWMGFILVPVYLVIRAIKTNRNFVPAILWCFLFAVDMLIL